mgnify:FL=1
MTTQNRITAEFLWRQHRAALGGRSAISGAPLPETLAECAPGVQASHWGMAAAVSRLLGHDEPALPVAVTPQEAERVRASLSICSSVD